MTRTITKKTICWNELAEKSIRGECLTREEGLAVLRSKDEELLALLHAAYRVRFHFYGNKVKLNLIINAKSGLCPEDCGYCSQSIVSKAPIAKYPLLEKEVLIEGARQALKLNVGTYCIVASGRGPTNRELGQVIEAVEEIKATMPLKICACLGRLSDEQAARLQAAGVDRYNHNLNTSSSNHARITSTHTYSDRVETVNNVKRSGMSPCSGVIIGMKESDQDVLDMAYALRGLDVDSIPVNFLNPIEGTPLEGHSQLNPRQCLRTLALIRLVCPTKEIRIAGGREIHLRSLQPLGLYAANSIFIGDYLTTKGQEQSKDYQMLEDMGFEIETCAL